MELRHLQYFVAVAEERHFTRAAARLHVAQPALSQQIRVLERELGAPLFERTSRSVRLTPAGAALLPYARRVLATVEDARREVAEQSSEPVGSVRLGVTPTVAAHLLPRRLAAFRRRYPRVEVYLTEGGAVTLEQELAAGTLDLAVIRLPPRHHHLEVAVLLEEELLLGVSLAHPLAGRGAVALAEVADEPFVLYREGYGLRDAVLSACQIAGFQPRIALDGGETETVLRLCAAGLGVTLVPPIALQDAVLPPATVRLTEPVPRRVLGLAWRHERLLTRAQRALRDALLGRELPAEDAVGTEV